VTSNDLQNREGKDLGLMLALLRHNASLDLHAWVAFQMTRIGGPNVLAQVSPALAISELAADTINGEMMGTLKGEFYMGCPVNFNSGTEDVVPLSIEIQSQSLPIMIYRSFSITSEYAGDIELKCLNVITGDTLYYELKEKRVP
jgi:hypothetical protein